MAVLGLLLVGCSNDGSSSREADTRQHRRQAEAEIAKQPERLKFINELIEKRVFTKVNVDELVPDIYVGPAFFLVDFETKQNFVSVVYAYTKTSRPNLTLVQLYDNMTGKEIGRYTESGLKIY
jgi:hypothetical protein